MLRQEGTERSDTGDQSQVQPQRRKRVLSSIAKPS